MPPPQLNPFNPANWYWYVGGDTSRAYSSAVGDYVPAADATFTAWLADPGNRPTRIDTEDNLGRSLAQYESIIARPVPVAILNGFKDQKADVATNVYKVLMAPNNLNWENRIRALERATGLGTLPDLTAAQLKQLLKSLA